MIGKHIPCDKCGSSDAATYYEDSGLIHCFSCEATYKPKEGGHKQMQKKEQGFKNEVEDTKPIVLPAVSEITTTIRGISPATFKQFSYFKGANGEHVAQMYDINGKVVAHKMRYKDKTFSWKGQAKKAVPFGMNQWRQGGKRITITEGEIDAMSISEAMGGRFPTISLSNGAAAAKRDLTEHLEFINSFEQIVLWFDQDEAGRKAIAECTSLFTPGKVYTVDTGPYKDANEILLDKGKQGLLHYYYEIKQHTPNGIVNANEGGFESILEEVSSDEVYTTPYDNLTISKGAITTFVSGTGMGKSTIVREIGCDLLRDKHLRIGHVALEENNAVSKRAYLGIALNENIVGKSNWSKFKENPENIAKIKEAYNAVIAPGNLYLYNHFGSLSSDSLLSKLRYLAVGAQCDVIILDHLSIVVSGMEDMGDNERRVIDVLMTKLRSLVEETGVGFILISHLKRPNGNQGHEDGIQVSLSHLRGSGAIAQLSDKVIALEGNQQDEEFSKRRVIRCLKDREDGENTGILGTATYNSELGRLLADDPDGILLDYTGSKQEEADRLAFAPPEVDGIEKKEKKSDEVIKSVYADDSAPF